MNEFITPPDHVGFLAKKLFAGEDKIIDIAIAHIGADGGGPVEPHTHPHDHLFIVAKGKAKVLSDGETFVVGENESLRVKGSTPHSMWNNSSQTTVVVGISLSGYE